MSRTSPLPRCARVPCRLVPLLLVALVAGGCSDEDPIEAPTVENFARPWHLTSCVYRPEAGEAPAVDLVAAGWVIDLHVNDNGRLRYSWTPPGDDLLYWDGAWSADGTALSVTRDGNGFAWEFTARVQESSMTLTGAHAEYDFDGDGTPEAATWDLAGTHD